ncbi:fibrinogen-like protein A [Drosophila nasuta]|uniref:fibrinogen-like protein A n=1 Tax=Drosophila nasuta TaxID=42062 RepID=UPI00295E28DC|nr:fibrinogen-like protein A [Drosophila nasuta]
MFTIRNILILAASFALTANEIKAMPSNPDMSAELEQSARKDREISALKRTQEINEALINELRSQIQFQMSIINKLNENSSTNISCFDPTTIQMQLEESRKKFHRQSCQLKDDQLNSSLLIGCIITSEYITHYVVIRYLSEIGTIYVPCDYQLGAPGWMVIQRRIDGAQNFTENWDTYRKGFGYADNSDYFLGMERIHRLTSSRCYELHLHLEFENGSIAYAHYDDFRVSDEVSGYAITVGAFTGNTTDVLSGYDNVKFSTFDRNNENINCPRSGQSGWWFKSCSESNLNGMWNHFNWDSNNLRKSKMLIRPLEIK